MNKINIKKISITNFKGVASFEMDFDPKLTQIKGPSGSSKTTILDAIKWCLGYPIKNWEPTTSQDRVKVPDIITDIELTLECNGSQYVIKRTAEQSFKTSAETGAKLFTGYEYAYSFDGVACKAKDFQVRVADLFEVQYDKLLWMLDTKIFLDDTQTNWADRRKWLYQLLDIDNKTENLANKKEYELIAEDLKKGKSEIDIQKMLNAEKKGISDDQTRNKVIIDSKVKEMTELANIDFGGIEKRKTELNTEISTLQAQSKQGQTNTLLATKQRELEQIRTKFMEVSISIKEQEQKLDYQKRELDGQINGVAGIKSDIYFCQNKIKKLDSELEDCKFETEEVQSQKFDQEKTTCPTCKQTLPLEKIEELKASFEKDKEKRLANINSKAENNAIERQNTESRINTLTNKLNSLNGDLNALNEVVVDKTQITALEKELADKQIEIDNLPKLDIDNTINEKINTLKIEYENCIRELVKKDQLAKIKTEIQELKDNSKELAQKDASRIARQNQLRAYIEEKVAFVSTEINSHFDGITWQLFTKNSDMAENLYEQNCFTVYNGSTFVGNSTGEKIFVCNKVNEGLQKLLGINIFVFVDEKQSSTIPYETDKQVVELITSTNQNFKNVKISDVFGK